MPDSVKEGDTKTLKWNLGRDLTGVSEARVFIGRKGHVPAVNRAGSMNNPNPAAGIVSLALEAADYAAGKLEADQTYLVEVQTLPGPLTHPDDGYEYLTVMADLA